MMENWKYIPGFEGLYQASDIGRIRSVDRYVKQHSGGQQLKKSRILSPAISRLGYPVCALSVKNKSRSCHVHRLIAITFLGDPPTDKVEVNHIDGNKRNNNIKNLEWIDRKGNILHAERMGLINHPRGERHPNSKLTDSERLEIISLKKSGMTLRELSLIYPLSIGNLSKIK